MSAEQTVERCSALSKNLTNYINSRLLFDRAYISGEHKAFKEYMENNPVKENFDASLKYGITLVVDETRTMSKVAPTMILLLQNGATWGRIVRRTSTKRTPYHIICGSTGDHHELLELTIKDLGRSLLNAKYNKKRTALMYAVQNANVKCVESLIANGADVNVVSKYSLQKRPNVTDMIRCAVSPLIDSINMLHPDSPHSPDTMMDIFDILLDSGADVNQPCFDLRRTPIMYAAGVGNMHCFDKLIGKGAEIDCTDEDGYTLCTLAAHGGNVEILKYLLEDNAIDKNSIDKKGLSVLYWAVRGGNIEAVCYLLNLGVKITSYTPKQYVEACRDCGINLTWHNVNNQRRTSDPYMLAIGSNKPDIVRLFEENGCQLYKAIDTLLYAICKGSERVVDYLLCNYKYPLNNGFTCSENRANIKWASRHQTLLTNACQSKSVNMIKLLLQHGADPNINICEAKQPSTINVAIFNQHVEVIACFIRGGVNVNTRSYHPGMGLMLPFETAVYMRHIYAAQMLLVTGCSHGVLSLDGNNHKLTGYNSCKMRKLLKTWNLHLNIVLPLQQRCRMVILNHLSPQADEKITELPLPLGIIKYLSIPELDDIINDFVNARTNYYVK